MRGPSELLFYNIIYRENGHLVFFGTFEFCVTCFSFINNDFSNRNNFYALAFFYIKMCCESSLLIFLIFSQSYDSQFIKYLFALVRFLFCMLCWYKINLYMIEWKITYKFIFYFVYKYFFIKNFHFSLKLKEKKLKRWKKWKTFPFFYMGHAYKIWKPHF